MPPGNKDNYMETTARESEWFTYDMIRFNSDFLSESCWTTRWYWYCDFVGSRKPDIVPLQRHLYCYIPDPAHWKHLGIHLVPRFERNQCTNAGFTPNIDKPHRHDEKRNTGCWFGCHQFYSPINIGNVIIPIDELIFFRGVAQPPTRTCFMIENT